MSRNAGCGRFGWALALLALGACSGDDAMAGNTNDSKGKAGAGGAEQEPPRGAANPAETDEPAASGGNKEPADDTDPAPSTDMMMAADEDPAAPDKGGADQPAQPSVSGEARAYMDDAGDGWKSLIEGKWELPANTEGYRCVRFTLPEDVWINEFRPVIPLGTHHTVLTVGEPGGADGTSVCTVGVNAPNGVFGSGVGTKDFTYPEGIGIHLRAGQQLVLNLHLFNTSNKPLTGVSGTLIKAIPEAKVQHAATSMLAGTTTLDIPVGGPTVQTGQCTMDQDVTLIAVVPHMHQLGVHLKAVAESSLQGEVVLHDGDYDFDSQISYPLDSVAMKKGDVVRVECTYQNTTDADVHFGDSSLAEMCFVGLTRYPEGGRFTCTR